MAYLLCPKLPSSRNPHYFFPSSRGDTWIAHHHLSRFAGARVHCQDRVGFAFLIIAVYQQPVRMAWNWHLHCTLPASPSFQALDGRLMCQPYQVQRTATSSRKFLCRGSTVRESFAPYAPSCPYLELCSSYNNETHVAAFVSSRRSRWCAGLLPKNRNWASSHIFPTV